MNIENILVVCVGNICRSPMAEYFLKANEAINLRDGGMTLSDVLGESEGVNPYSASAAR
ncbi:hypothetical protein ACG9X1_08820, partial [Acinetobacter baumannii]